MTYPKRVLIALDQLFAVVLFGTMPDETISAMAHRRGWKRLERLINWLFCDECDDDSSQHKASKFSPHQRFRCRW